MRLSKYDDTLTATQAFELGHMLKEWSFKKSQRDMKKFVPNFDESRDFQKYLQYLERQDENVKITAMNKTEIESTLLMHGQDRNRHGKIFGGYLMRQAFDMSWITASLFQE